MLLLLLFNTWRHHCSALFAIIGWQQVNALHTLLSCLRGTFLLLLLLLFLLLFLLVFCLKIHLLVSPLMHSCLHSLIEVPCLPLPHTHTYYRHTRTHTHLPGQDVRLDTHLLLILALRTQTRLNALTRLNERLPLRLLLGPMRVDAAEIGQQQGNAGAQ